MITTGNWQLALEPYAIKSAQLGYREKPMERDVLFSVKKSKKLTDQMVMNPHIFPYLLDAMRYYG